MENLEKICIEKIERITTNKVNNLMEDSVQKIFQELLFNGFLEEEIEKTLVKILVLNSKYHEKYKK